MIIHASLITDLFNYHYNWLYSTLKRGYFDIREMNNKDVLRYNLKGNKVKIWTYNLKTPIKKVKQIEDLGYEVELINTIGFQEEMFAKNIDNRISVVERFEKHSSKLQPNICFGVLYKNAYTTAKFQLSNMKRVWDSIKRKPFKVYLDFNINEGLQRSRKYNAKPLNEEEREFILKEFKEYVGDDVEVVEKPSYYDLRGDVDLGHPNICSSLNLLSEGMHDYRKQRSLLNLHYDDQTSIILKERPGENIIEVDDLEFTKEGPIERIEEEIEVEEKTVLNFFNMI